MASPLRKHLFAQESPLGKGLLPFGNRNERASMQGYVGTSVSPPGEGLETGFARAKEVFPRSSSLRPGSASPARWTGLWGRQWCLRFNIYLYRRTLCVYCFCLSPGHALTLCSCGLFQPQAGLIAGRGLRRPSHVLPGTCALAVLSAPPSAWR